MPHPLNEKGSIENTIEVHTPFEINASFMQYSNQELDKGLDSKGSQVA